LLYNVFRLSYDLHELERRRIRRETNRILFEYMNFGSEGSRGVYKLYEVMRNVQVMRKGEKSPGGVGEPTCNLELVPCLHLHGTNEIRTLPLHL
jgi:hypothetical protein